MANIGRWVYVSSDQGRTWTHSLTLPESSSVRGVLPTGVAKHDGAIYVGEYLRTYNETPHVLCSDDGGSSWRPVLSFPDARHIHAVQSDPYSKRLWITTGDTDDESRIGYLKDSEFVCVGSGSQAWRTVGLVFTAEEIIWGMDCPYTHLNSILKLDRANLYGEPTELHALENPVYYATALKSDDESIVVFSTGSGSGNDNTAPDEERASEKTRTVEIWMAGSYDEFSEWVLVDSFHHRTNGFDYIGYPQFSANAYVFLAGDDQRGLFLNPYNTKRSSGEILHYGISELTNRLRKHRAVS